MSKRDECKIVGDNIRYYLKLNGKTQAHVAAYLNVSRGTFSDWANGRVFPRYDKLKMLANYFSVQVGDLVEERSVDKEYFLNKESVKIANALCKRPDLVNIFEKMEALRPSDIALVFALVDRLSADERQ